MKHSPFRLSSIAQWDVWKLHGRVLTAVLMVETLAVGLIVLDVWRDQISTHSLIVSAYLCGGAVLHTEISHGIEQTRRRVGPPGHVDLTSVWTFAAAILLPLSLATATALVVLLHFNFRVLRPAKTPAFKQIFNSATVVLAVHAAAATIGYVHTSLGIPAGLPSIVGICFALLAYTVVNTSLVVGVVAMTTPDTFARALMSRGEGVGVEIATLCFGGLLANTFQPGRELMILLFIPPLVLVHRSLLARQLVREARTDSRTGCLNSAAWHLEATTSLEQLSRRADRTALLLMIDLDWFKTINDTHGHLAGDGVLEAVGEVLRSQAREDDVVGRYGGEEFVMLLPCSPWPSVPTVTRIADRIRAAIGALEVTVDAPDGPLTIEVTASVGATVSHDGESLRALVSRADAALYAAKRAGRNRTRIVESGAPRRDHPGPSSL